MNNKYHLKANEIFKEEFAALRSLLEHNGIVFEYSEDTLLLHVDAKKLTRMNKRNAGPKEKGIYLSGSPSAPVYLRDIEELQKTHSMQEIARMYNTSRRTLYRRIEEAKRSGSDQVY